MDHILGKVVDWPIWLLPNSGYAVAKSQSSIYHTNFDLG